MQCPRCKHEVIPGVIFCPECEAPLKVFLEELNPVGSAIINVGQEDPQEADQQK